jgi:L-alanine-DL-glutamate epimerase-like enolase superfamily enzyme
MMKIENVRVVTINHILPVPIIYGNWIMDHREFALVRVDLDNGVSGFSYALTRDGPIASIVNRSIAPCYKGKELETPEPLYFGALWTNHAVHAAGIGMRSLSLVDIATWDAYSRSVREPLGKLLGGEVSPLPATAIVGYPPTMKEDELVLQIKDLQGKGWRRFKIPISPDLELSERRLRAAREVAPNDWIGFDINMVLRDSASVLEFERRIRDLKLGWIEDVVPPGNANMVAEVRKGSETPVAMGDEQGGSYHPEALLAASAVDILRVDATTNGGITGLNRVLTLAKNAGVKVSPHMFPHFHSRLLPIFGWKDVPIEWGVPGTGVHPMDDGLEQPTLKDGLMHPLKQGFGFGNIVDRRWILTQKEVSDPDGALEGIPEDCLGGPEK